MKRIFTLLALVLAGANAMAAAMNDNGHKLTDLWAQYDEAKKADRPQKEAEILKQIKEKASAERLPVDFYDAATEYVNTVARRDWKQREQALRTLQEEVKALDYPIVTFLWMNDYQSAPTDELWAYVKANMERFQGRNTPFYRNIGSYLGGNLAPFVQSDKEYVLWRMLLRRSYINIETDEIYQALAQEVDGRYPAQPALEFYALTTRAYSQEEQPQRKAALEELATRYPGKAVALYPRGLLLRMEMDRLVQENAPQEAFQELYAAAEAFEQERKAFEGEEALIVRGYTNIKNLCDQLTRKGLTLRVDKSGILVCFQNLPEATVVLYKDNSQGKKVKTWKVKNLQNSFYVKDTVRLELPALADGHYELTAEKDKTTAYAQYNQYTLSLAVRADADGWSSYATDHRSGEPLRNVKLRLYRSGKQLAVSTVSQKGFTRLPCAMRRIIEKKPDAYYVLVAEQGDRRSRDVSLYDYYYSWTDDGVRCNLYRDRGAYNPGDTLQFKAVVYEGDPMKAFQVCAGKKLTAILRDSERNELEKMELTSNEFGSVSGSFLLPKGLRNGQFMLDVREDGYSLASMYFRVDEFVLPTFDLAFEKDDKLYQEGDQVPVKGQVTSYSGHSLTGAQLSLQVSAYGDVVLEETCELGPDGRFSFTFPARDAGSYEAEVTVTDATGETKSFRTFYCVSDGISVNMSVLNAAEGSFVLPGEETRLYSSSKYIVDGNTLRARLEVRGDNYAMVAVPLEYCLKDTEGQALRQGRVDSGTVVEIDLSGVASGLYTLETKASVPTLDGKGKLEADRSCQVLLHRPADKTISPLVKRMHIFGPAAVADGTITLKMGATYGPAWVTATLFGENRKVLAAKTYTFAQGVPGEIGFDYAVSYPDAVRLQVFYFMDGESVTIDREFRREKNKLSLPLRYTRFQSSAYPHTEYTFSLKTEAGVEALAGIWDKSLDAISSNYWPQASMRNYSVPAVRITSLCGHVTGEAGEDPVVYNNRVSRSAGRLLAKGAVAEEVMDDMALGETVVVGYAAAPAAQADRIASDNGQEEPEEAQPVIRNNFANVITFQPHLRPAADGTLEFSFKTADKLSTYYVTVYAHGKDMRNALVQEEMVVSLPVKVALVEPQFLYEGDRYEAALTVSSISEKPVSGRLQLRYGDNLQEVPVTVPAGEVVSHRFLVSVPSAPEGELVLTASFLAADFSDAVQVKVPVYPAAQTLTEAHSAVLLSGMDREALLQELRSRFVNVPGASATLREITVLDMVKDAIPSHVEPSGKDVLSLSEAWYVQLLAGRLSAKTEDTASSAEELLKKILACRNADGGFGWFEGMTSSAIITAVLLERFAKLRDRGFQVPDMTSAVKFLDKTHFGTTFPLWRGWVSDEQYAYVRSLYPNVSFGVHPVTKADKKQFSEFKKDMKAYLTPSKKDGRGLEGRILAKARRLLTLRNLCASSQGVALAKEWGIDLNAKAKLEQSMQADLLSLTEYAVEHRDGGWYYPNAVMPWRGLLESEAYAHALLCDLMAGAAAKGLASEGASPADIADGIRLWLMLQKETQKWDTDPAFVDAIISIMDGSDSVLGTRVLALSATYEAPFSSIKAAGNGFTIERKFFREVTEEQIYDNTTSSRNRQVSTLQEIKPGDPVKVGEKIIVQYQIWNAENRSFVKLDAGREASLRPVQQLSGHVGYGFIRPVRNGYVFGFTPQGYRNVKAERTEYFFDSYPEEKTTLTEEFFVTQAGEFVAPVVTIESLYAPHYRANSNSRGILSSQPVK